MGSLCFSTASILRCESLTRLQAIIVLIPTALEVIFSTSLIFTNRGAGRRHLWITAEGWVYLALAIVEMLSHILPAGRDSVNVLKVLDTVLAATSFLPILFYILFICLFTRTELIDVLPIRFQTVMKLMLPFFIPAIVAFNEVASFIGLSRRTSNTKSMSLVIGFRSPKDQLLWTFFTSLTLAFLIVYQAMSFSLTFYRLAQALLNRRRMETMASDETHLFRGVGWIAGGFKLGAIETVAGFAGGGFGGALIRRILRLLARACLCIGLAKGMDSAVDFKQIRAELSASNKKEFRRSRLREFISNPRLSTFHQLTPTATAFHATPRAPRGLSQFSPGPRTQGGLAGMRQFAEMKQPPQQGEYSEKTPFRRVTVNFEKGTPSLHVRFSALELPPEVFVRPRPVNQWMPVSRRVSYRPPSTHQISPTSLLSSLELSDTRGQELKSPPRLYNPAPKAPRVESSYSIRSNPESYMSLSAVRELTSQFPLPTRLETVEQSPAGKQPDDFWDTASVVSIPGSQPIVVPPTKPESAVDPFYNENELFLSAVPVSVPLGQPLRSKGNTNESLSPTTIPVTTSSDYKKPRGQSVLTTDTDEFLDFGNALDTGQSRAFMRNSNGTTHPAEWIDYDAIQPIRRLPSIAERPNEPSHTSPDVASRLDDFSNTRRSDALRASWLKNLEMEKEEKKSTRVSSRRTVQPTRIKSIGKAPMRSTPTPTKKSYTRRSLHIEPIMIPPKQPSGMEIIQGSLSSANTVLRDSEVLAIESGSGYSRDLRYF